MTKNRLEAFSDGVIAIIITIMVLELRAPHGASLGALKPLVPSFLSYALSFVFLGIYWNNHHHMLHTVRRVTGGVLWANLHLLFWLSLIPFATAWLGEAGHQPIPVACYGVVMLLSAIAYFVLQGAIIRVDGPESPLAKAVGKDVKGKLSLGAYLVSIPLALFLPSLSVLLFVVVALMWLVPDRRIESALR